MNNQALENIAKKLTTPGKGLLAADESNTTCEKRFEAVGIGCTSETRRAYRQLLLTTPAAEQFLSGVIFFDETFWQVTNHHQPFREYLHGRAITPGIKVDKGLVDLPGFEGEKITNGLDDLVERIERYAAAGVQFAKWRAVITVGEGIPTPECISANAFCLARYGRICQDANIVPILEPEILYDGTHNIEQCEQAMIKTLDMVFRAAKIYRVHLPGAILKTSMVLPGKDSTASIDHDDVAQRTHRVLQGHVPRELGGVVFLSGGQQPNDAFINLNRIAKLGPYPWGVTYSYSRALQDQVLKTWAKDQKNIDRAQTVFKRLLTFAAAASQGKLDESELDGESFVSRSQDM